MPIARVTTQTPDVKTFLKDMAITQHQLSEVIGFSQPRISLLLNNKAPISSDFVASMMAAFDAPFALFFDLQEIEA